MDDELIERLLASPATAADEAPELAMLLAAASTYPTDLGPLAGQEAALAAFRAGPVAAPPRRKRMLGKALAAKTLAMLGAGTLVLGGGVAAAAAADTLPVPAQNAISGAASHVGLDFPNHAKGNHHGWQNSHNPHHGNGNGNGNHGTDQNGNGDNGTQPDNHGAYVSGVARTASPGPGHGKAVSDEAHSQDGKPTPASSHGPDANATDHGATDQSKAGDGAPEPQETETSEPPETDTSGAPSGLGSSHAPGSHG